MSDLSKLKEILDNQAERGIRSGNWDRLDYKEQRRTAKESGISEDSITLTIEALEVGFAFTIRGRLLGMYNWKE